MVLKSVLKV